MVRSRKSNGVAFVWALLPRVAVLDFWTRSPWTKSLTFSTMLAAIRRIQPSSTGKPCCIQRTVRFASLLDRMTWKQPMRCWWQTCLYPRTGSLITWFGIDEKLIGRSTCARFAWFRFRFWFGSITAGPVAASCAPCVPSTKWFSMIVKLPIACVLVAISSIKRKVRPQLTCYERSLW